MPEQLDRLTPGQFNELKAEMAMRDRLVLQRAQAAQQEQQAQTARPAAMTVEEYQAQHG